MEDEEFLRKFHVGTLPDAEFRHRGHLRLTWLVRRRHDLDSTQKLIASGIKSYAAARGAGGRYHETLTRFWVHIVNHAMATEPAIEDFDLFLARFPMLMNKELPYSHWRRETIMSNHARRVWLGPDLLPLP